MPSITKPAHTPTPWSVGGYDPLVGEIFIYGPSKDSAPVAASMCADTNRPQDENKANADLIAALKAVENAQPGAYECVRAAIKLAEKGNG